MKICLATVLSPEFLSGALTTLHSFLKHNSWFRGDIVIICEDLSQVQKEQISESFDRVLWMEVSELLKNRLFNLVNVIPSLRSRYKRFYSVESFAIHGYDKTIFCDCDLLFRDSIEAMVDFDGPLVCCGDASHYRGLGRNRITYQEEPLCESNRTSILTETFNAGLMIIDSSLASPETYARLMKLLDAEKWLKIRAGQTDQLLYNLAFSGRQKLFDSSYNFLLGHPKCIFSSERRELTEAKVLHFNGPDKPWLPNRLLLATQKNPKLVWAYELWYKEFAESLASRNLRGQVWSDLKESQRSLPESLK